VIQFVASKQQINKLKKGISLTGPLSSCYVFTYLKNWLKSQSFSNIEELMEDVRTWLSPQAADFFDTGIQKLLRYKCLSSGGYYIEK
jgi:hypothetical protein